MCQSRRLDFSRKEAVIRQGTPIPSGGLRRMKRKEIVKEDRLDPRGNGHADDSRTEGTE